MESKGSVGELPWVGPAPHAHEPSNQPFGDETCQTRTMRPFLRRSIIARSIVLALVLTACRTAGTSERAGARTPDGREASPVVELRGARWFTGQGFAAGSRWVQGGRFVARPPVGTARVVSLDGLYLVPPYADAHTHSPDGSFNWDNIRNAYLDAGVLYVQVLANHRSGRLAMQGLVNAPGEIEATFADAAVTSSGGHPQLLYESLAKFYTPVPPNAERVALSRARSQEGEVYLLLDSLPDLPGVVRQLRRDGPRDVAILKVMLLDGAHFAEHRNDTAHVGGRGIDPTLLGALVDSAHAIGRRVWVHVETAQDFADALAAGVDGMAHVPGYGVAFAPDSLLPSYRLSDASIALAARRKIPVVTTLGLSRDTAARDPIVRRRLEQTAFENVRRLAAAGVPILTGSDTYSSREAIENDYESLGEVLQLSPLETLRLRSVNTPRAIRPGRRVGALDPGYDASLLALACNPLEDTKCQQRIVARLKDGIWITPPPSAPLGAACALGTADSLLGVTLAAMHARNPVPGISGALVVRDRPDTAVARTVGRVSAEREARPLGAADRLLAGSVGKTFWASLALRRAARGTLDLDRAIARAIRETGIPAFAWITPRMLLRHTSGIGEYDEVFMRGLIREPLRTRTTADWLDVLRRNPPAANDTGKFRYSDINYVVLAMLLGGGSEGRAYQAVESELLKPLGLTGTVPSIAPRVPGLVPGFDGSGSMFGRDAMMQGDSLVYNPQFEWGGGGFASTPSDLARWMADMRLGRAFPLDDWSNVIARPPGIADTAQHWRGMGLHVDVGSLGPAYGHSGYMPGYVSWMRWYERSGVAVAIQVNASDTLRLRDDGFDWADSVVVGLGRACRIGR